LRNCGIFLSRRREKSRSRNNLTSGFRAAIFQTMIQRLQKKSGTKRIPGIAMLACLLLLLQSNPAFCRCLAEKSHPAGNHPFTMQGECCQEPLQNHSGHGRKSTRHPSVPDACGDLCASCTKSITVSHAKTGPVTLPTSDSAPVVLNFSVPEMAGPSLESKGHAFSGTFRKPCRARPVFILNSTFLI